MLAIPLRATRSAVEFTLRIDYAIGSEEKSITLDDGGQPFRFTGYRGDPTADSADPDAVYTMRGDFSHCELDPNHMSSSTTECSKPR